MGKFEITDMMTNIAKGTEDVWKTRQFVASKPDNHKPTTMAKTWTERARAGEKKTVWTNFRETQ
jgi:hypothetical protein